MNSKPKLTSNGILYISLGFKQRYCLQVFSLRRGDRGEVQMVLYDGLVYIGATFESPFVILTLSRSKADQKYFKKILFIKKSSLAVLE